MERKSIGTLIAALRRANGMTQKDLAEMLHVSDKAVSRWERDESMPDLAVLPQIADVFQITVDELIRGEKKNAAQSSTAENTEAEQTRLRKQLRRVTDAALYRFRERMLLAAGIGMAALLAAAVCNLGFNRGVLAFVLGIIIWLCAAGLMVFFVSDFFKAMKEDGYSEEDIRAYRVSVIHWTKYASWALLGQLAFLLPLIQCLFDVGSASTYHMELFLLAGNWVRMGLLAGAVMSACTACALYFINRRLLAAGLYPSKARHKKQGIVAFSLAALMLVTAVWSAAVRSRGITGFSHSYTFDDFASFQTFAQERAIEYYEEMGINPEGEDEFRFQPVYAPDTGEEIGKIDSYGISSYSIDSEGTFTVYTPEDIEKAIWGFQKAMNRYDIVLILLPAAAGLVWLGLRREKK